MIDSVGTPESALIGFMLFAEEGAWSKLDRRRCVVSAIESGSSCRAAVQFDVSASSAIRWRLSRGGRRRRARASRGRPHVASDRGPCRAGAFTLGGEARHGRAAGPFSPMLSKRSSPNCGRASFGAYQRLGSPNQRTTHVYERRIKNCAPRG